MKYSLNQRGSTHLIAVLAVVVIAAVGAVGYKVMNQPDYSQSSTPVASGSAKVPTTIKSKSDVRKASAALDSTTIDSSVNPNQLDSDLNTLL